MATEITSGNAVQGIWLLRLGLLATIVALPAVAGCSDSGPSDGAIITFAFEGHPEDTLRAHVTREATIVMAQEIVAGERPIMFPIGPIRRGSGVDSRYPFHFVADSLGLASMAIELCDGAPMHTSAEVDAFFEGSTGSADSQSATWCPWGGYPIEVERLAR